MIDKNLTDFLNAAINGDTLKVKELVKSRISVSSIDVNVHGFTALMYASEKGHMEIVKFLVESGADVNMENDNGWTALLMASEGHMEIVKFLVENGADINHNERVYWNTALKIAAKYGYSEISEYLIEHGANTLEIDIVEWVNCGWLEKVKEYIEDGGNINQRVQLPYDDGRGNISPACTLLINAVMYERVNIVEYFLENGADFTLKGFSFEHGSQTALYYAKQAKHTEIIKLLKDAGATE